MWCVCVCVCVCVCDAQALDLLAGTLSSDEVPRFLHGCTTAVVAKQLRNEGTKHHHRLDWVRRPCPPPYISQFDAV